VVVTVGVVTDFAILTDLSTGRLVAATPSPDPTADLIGATADTAGRFWGWFTGWPLQVLLILVIGLAVLFVVRRAIHHVAERIARGYHRTYQDAVEAAAGAEGVVEGVPVSANASATGSSTGSSTVSTAPRKGRRRSGTRAVLVEDALGVTPEVKQRRAQRARTVGSVLGSAANIIILTIMALMILSAVGASEVVVPLIASAGVVGVALGFGAQSLVRDFLSGIFILVEDQFGVGDVVDFGFDVTGTVERMDLRLTHVRAFDGTLWHVRNGEILRAGNRTQQWARAVATVRVPVGSDVDSVRAALGRAVDSVVADERFAADLMEAPAVRGVDELTDGSYTFTVYGRVRPGADGEVARALLESSQLELVRAGIIVTAASDASPEELRPDQG